MVKKEKAVRIPSRFLEHDALAFDTSRLESDHQGRASTNYVAKREKKASGEEVVFDPAGHKEYLTGFHKRKVQRRNKAVKEQLTKARKEHLQVKAKKREELKERLGLGDNWGVEDSSEDEKANDKDARNLLAQVTYDHAHGGGVTTTVTTVALDSGPEDESEDEDQEEDGNQAAPTGRRKHEAKPTLIAKKGFRPSQKEVNLNKAAIKAAGAGVKKKKKRGDSTKGKTKSFKKHMKSSKKNSDGPARKGKK